MDYAVVLTGSKQYRLAPGDEINVEKLTTEVGKKVTFDQVLLVKNGEQILIGQPFINKAQVEAEVLTHFKDQKIRISKFKSKSRYRRTTGHRQPLTKVKIIQIKVK